MTGLIRAICDRWLIWALLSAALMLATAHAFETFGGYAPCTLCLRQREAYWAAGTVALAGVVLTRLPSVRRWRWVFDAALAVIFAYGLYLAVYHSGAEWKWWPGPTQCSGGGAKVDLNALTALADGTAKIKPPACDQAAWRWMGLSMAGWNALISLKLIVWSVLALLNDRRPA
jgi:disulfide bond formation protein DsbB